MYIDRTRHLIGSQNLLKEVLWWRVANLLIDKSFKVLLAKRDREGRTCVCVCVCVCIYICVWEYEKCSKGEKWYKKWEYIYICICKLTDREFIDREGKNNKYKQRERIDR